MALAPAYRTAIAAIGKAMGDQKHNHNMMGSMMPSGELDVATVIALLYKKPVASVRRKLAEAEKAEFHKIRARLMKKDVEMKKVCKKCGYWTRNKAHGKYKCYTNKCPAKQRDMRGKRDGKGN